MISTVVQTTILCATYLQAHCWYSTARSLEAIGWQRDRVAACPSEGSLLADCPGQLENTLCTPPGIWFQELRDKQAQIKIRFYLFLQPAVMFHPLSVYLFLFLFLFLFLSGKAFLMAMWGKEADCPSLGTAPWVVCMANHYVYF